MLLYSPKIREDLIPQLYRLAKGLHMPMTRLVNALLMHGIERMEQGVENVKEPPVGGSPRKPRTKRRGHYGRYERKTTAP